MVDVTASIDVLGICYSNLTSGAVYARSCWDLHVYGGKVYVGGGNAATGGTHRAADQEIGELKYWDPGTQAFVGTGFTPAENQVQTFRTIGSDLYIPGIDSEQALGGSDTNEGFAQLSGGTWTQYNQMFTNWSHCFDMYSFGGQLFAVGGQNDLSAGLMKVASNNIGHTSGAWAAMVTSDPTRMYSIFEANGKLYGTHSMDSFDLSNMNGLYVYASGTTMSTTGQKYAQISAGRSTSGVVSAKIYRPTHFLTKTFYILGEAYNDQQINPYSTLFSVTDSGTPGAGIDTATFASIAHPSTPTSPQPWDIWTDGTTLRVLWSYTSGSDIVVSLVETTDGASWSEVFSFIPNSVTGSAGGQTQAMAYEYLDGIHYFGLGSKNALTSDPAVQANNGEILAYTAPGDPPVVTKSINALSWAVRPDASNNVFPEPTWVKVSNDLYGGMWWVFNAAATKRTLYSRFKVPKDYVSAPKIIVSLASSTTSSNIQVDVDCRAIADSESLDPTTHQESQNSGAIALPGTAWLRKDITVTLTAGTFAADDIVELMISIDSTTNVLAAIAWASFEYADA